MEERKAVLDERAKWITIGSTPDVMPGNLDKINGSVYFRKEFDAKDGIKEARLKICALGIGVYTINGTAVAELFQAPDGDITGAAVHRLTAHC